MHTAYTTLRDCLAIQFAIRSTLSSIGQNVGLLMISSSLIKSQPPSTNSLTMSNSVVASIPVLGFTIAPLNGLSFCPVYSLMPVIPNLGPKNLSWICVGN